MSDTAQVWLQNALKTQFAGASLSACLYDTPVDILLTGELGAGKTTFLKGFAHSLQISEPITSPTYALEQRYRGSRELIHIDLYRLDENQSRELITSTDDHEGVRCIEWAERAMDHVFGKTISINLADKDDGRILTATFDDIPLPERAQVEKWRREFHLPDPIQRHCDAVAAFALQLAEDLMQQGSIVRPLALKRAAEVHDLFRFVDFRSGGGHEEEENSKEQIACWEAQKKKYSGLKHEPTCAAFLREKGFEALAAIVEVHGLILPTPKRTTIEQKLLYYSDKRVMLDTIVSLDKRFDDFAARYGRGKTEGEGKIWYEEAKRVERELQALRGSTASFPT